MSWKWSRHHTNDSFRHLLSRFYVCVVHCMCVQLTKSYGLANMFVFRATLYDFCLLTHFLFPNYLETNFRYCLIDIQAIFGVFEFPSSFK